MLKMQSNELEDQKYAGEFIGLFNDWHSTFMVLAALEFCKVADCASAVKVEEGSGFFIMSSLMVAAWMRCWG